jgi:hypothetical protein
MSPITGAPITGATSYGTVAELRTRLPQVPAGAATDALLQELLDQATAVVDGELGFSFAAYGAATDRDIRAQRSGEELFLPCYELGGITAVKRVSGRGTTSESTEDITDYVAGEDARPAYLWRGAGWTGGAWYRVTAPWGYGEAPVDVVKVTLELAVNDWRGRDRGMYSDVIGVEGGGAVGYARSLTNQQRMILQDVRLKYGEFGVA